MKEFRTLKSTAVPLRAENVDTDQIIPARYLTTVSREGLGKGLFDAWRYHQDGSSVKGFVMNRPEYQGSEVLLAGANFGSGSSREHAVWALTDYGFRVVIAPSFADIFYNNSLKNGLLPVALSEAQVEGLMADAEENPESALTVDLEAQTVSTGTGAVFAFEIAPFWKSCLLKGLDDLGYLLERAPEIAAYEAAMVCS